MTKPKKDNELYGVKIKYSNSIPKNEVWISGKPTPKKPIHSLPETLGKGAIFDGMSPEAIAIDEVLIAKIDEIIDWLQAEKENK